MRVVVLTGAGISAESGLATFRDSDGLWEGHDPMQVATPEAYDEDPGLVHRFYDARRAALSRVRPNAAHDALARLEEALGDDLLVVTQNVDDLHERAGSSRVHHIHGRLRSAWCTTCDERHEWDGALGDRPACPWCGEATLRPDIVWFGEIPYGMDVVEQALWELRPLRLDRHLRTSSTPRRPSSTGRAATTLELNLEPSAGATDFAASRQGPATELVPAWVAELLG